LAHSPPVGHLLIRSVLGSSRQTWVGGIMLTAERVIEKKAPNVFEQRNGDALANLATSPATHRGN